MTLAAGLARLQLELPRETQQKLLDYLALVQKWNKVYNLTAIRNAEAMLTHHLLDSLAVAPHVRNAKTILDAGSGAGLPGIPLALALPNAQVTLLDSNQKKAAFLQQATIELPLANVNVICDLVENIQLNQGVTFVVSRAFAELAKFVALAGHLIARGGTLLAMKGALPSEEIAQLPGDFKVSRVVPLNVPGVHAQRHLVFIEAAA
ncbi:MAG: 16S rRNA (guanine(527)-N(7))-methyltransferase RsmG [Betaproteobacteria bacterium]|nr:16S rRNA (guanine(527)-N(7))-methyltransferase RsmG [Betaproteobacteria bacterium]